MDSKNSFRLLLYIHLNIVSFNYEISSSLLDSFRKIEQVMMYRRKDKAPQRERDGQFLIDGTLYEKNKNLIKLYLPSYIALRLSIN